MQTYETHCRIYCVLLLLNFSDYSQGAYHQAGYAAGQTNVGNLPPYSNFDPNNPSPFDQQQDNS